MKEEREMALEEWLDAIFHEHSKMTIRDWAFPADKHRDEYIKTIDRRTDEEVCRLLIKFLIPSGTLGIDKSVIESLPGVKEKWPEMYARMMRTQYFQRLVRFVAGKNQPPPWEGITWVLDLLPHFPKKALEGLDAYCLAHIQFLPDGRIEGLFDAATIIRAKFVGLPNTSQERIRFLLDLQPREFECVVERTYKAMGYKTRLTPPQNDGGRDVIATTSTPGKLEHLRIECKRYSRPVGIEIVRGLLGVVSHEKVNKGVLVAAGTFTRGAARFASRNPRLELITGQQFVLLANEHLGSQWPLHIERLVIESQQPPENPPLRKLGQAQTQTA